MKATISQSDTGSTKCAFCGILASEHPHQSYITTDGRGSITIGCLDTKKKLLHSSHYTRDVSASMSPAQEKLLAHYGLLITLCKPDKSEKS